MLRTFYRVNSKDAALILKLDRFLKETKSKPDYYEINDLTSKVRDNFCLLSVLKKELEQAWLTLAEANIDALQIEKTTHKNYSYAREVKLMSINDDLTAVTKPEHRLSHYDSIKPMLSCKGAIFTNRDYEKLRKEYERHKRAPDIEILNRDLYVHLDAAVNSIQDKYRQITKDLDAMRVQAEEVQNLYRNAKEQVKNESMTVDVITASLIESQVRQLTASANIMDVEILSQDVQSENNIIQFRKTL